MALRAARGSEALMGIALDATSDTFNVGQPALTKAADNYGFRFLRPDSFNFESRPGKTDPTELTGTAFRGRATMAGLEVVGTATGGIRTGYAVPEAYTAFGAATKTELVAGYAYQYVWTTSSKNSPRSLTAQQKKLPGSWPELFYGAFATQWQMSVASDEPGVDTLTMIGHHSSPHGIGFQVAGTGTFAGVLCVYGEGSDAFYASDGLWVKVTTAPTTGTFGLKIKVGNTSTYAGAEIAGYYDLSSLKQKKGGSQFTDRIIAFDEGGATLGFNDCDGKRDVGLLFTGGAITDLALNDEFFIPTAALIPGTYTVANLATNGTFTGNATGWTLGAGWAYGTNNIIHTAGSTETASQNFTAVSGVLYRLQFSVGGAAGTLTPSIGAVNGTAVAAGAGAVTQYLVAGASGSIALAFTPTTDFDGTLDSVVLEPLTGTGAVAYTGDAIDYIAGCKLTGAHVTVKKGGTAFEVMSAEITVTTPHEKVQSLGAGPTGTDIEGTGFWGLEATLTLRHRDRTFERLLQKGDRVTFAVEMVGPLLLDGSSVSTGYRNTYKYEANQAAVISSSSPVANENTVIETVVIRVETPDNGSEALTVTAITAEDY